MAISTMFNSVKTKFNPKLDVIPVWAVIDGVLHVAQQWMTYGGSRRINTTPFFERTSSAEPAKIAQMIASGEALVLEKGDVVGIYGFKDYSLKTVILFKVII